METTLRQDEALDLLAEQYRSVEVDVRPTGRVVATCWSTAPDLRQAGEPRPIKLATFVLDDDGRGAPGCVDCGYSRVKRQGLKCEACQDRDADLRLDASRSGECGSARIGVAVLWLSALVCLAVVWGVVGCGVASASAKLSVHEGRHVLAAYVARDVRAGDATAGHVERCRRSGRAVACVVVEEGVYSPMLDAVVGLRWNATAAVCGRYVCAGLDSVRDRVPFRVLR